MELFDLLIEKVIEELKGWKSNGRNWFVDWKGYWRVKREVSLVEGYSFNLSNSCENFWWIWWGKTYEKDYKFIKEKGWGDKRIFIKN